MNQHFILQNAHLIDICENNELDNIIKVNLYILFVGLYPPAQHIFPYKRRKLGQIKR